jgi:hypothetical protein
MEDAVFYTGEQVEGVSYDAVSTQLKMNPANIP